MNQSHESCLINFQDQNGPTLLWLRHKGKDNGSKSRTNLASVGSVFNDTRKVKVLSLPETMKEKSTFPLSFQVVREPLPFAYKWKQLPLNFETVGSIFT